MQSFQDIVEEMNVILTQKTIWLVFIRDEVSSRRKMKWTHEKMQIIDKIKIYSSYKARGKYSQKWVLFCITTRSVSYCLLFSFIVWIFFLFPSSSFVSCCILSCSQPVLLGFFSSGFYHFWFFFLFSIQFVYIALSIDLFYHASLWPIVLLLFPSVPLILWFYLYHIALSFLAAQHTFFQYLSFLQPFLPDRHISPFEYILSYPRRLGPANVIYAIKSHHYFTSKLPRKVHFEQYKQQQQ